jgi:hypothetical protein
LRGRADQGASFSAPRQHWEKAGLAEREQIVCPLELVVQAELAAKLDPPILYDGARPQEFPDSAVALQLGDASADSYVVADGVWYLGFVSKGG